MKIVTTLIALLTLVVGTNIFIRVQEQDRLDTALLLLDERISSNQTTITNIEDYMVDTALDFEKMQYIMMDNIKDVATSLEKHEHAPLYIEKPEVPVVKINFLQRTSFPDCVINPFTAFLRNKNLITGSEKTVKLQ